MAINLFQLTRTGTIQPEAKGPLKQAPGFITHFALPAEEGWDVYEVWQSKTEADFWFSKFIIPNLPSGVHPKRTYTELHGIVTAFEATIVG